MNTNDRNKLAYIARGHERRLREIERRLGITSPVNPLLNTSGHAEVAEPKESNFAAERQRG